MPSSETNSSSRVQYMHKSIKEDEVSMRFKNTPHSYGAISQLFHWSLALSIIGLFAMGLWMTDLGYYDDWYHRAPDLHKGIGVFVLLVWLGKMLWIAVNSDVKHEELNRWEIIAAKTTQIFMQVLLLTIILSGYLMSTVDGRSISVFGLFEIPSLLQQQGLENLSGWIHEFFTYALIGLASGHAFIALLHHFVHKDNVLRSMLPMSMANEDQATHETSPKHSQHNNNHY